MADEQMSACVNISTVQKSGGVSFGLTKTQLQLFDELLNMQINRYTIIILDICTVEQVPLHSPENSNRWKI